MKFVQLTETLVKSLVSDKEMVTVKEFPSESDDQIVLEVLVSSDDLSKVIGKSGKNANAIRTIVQASSNLYDRKRIIINIESF